MVKFLFPLQEHIVELLRLRNRARETIEEESVAGVLLVVGIVLWVITRLFGMGQDDDGPEHVDKLGGHVEVLDLRHQREGRTHM